MELGIAKYLINQLSMAGVYGLLIACQWVIIIVLWRVIKQKDALHTAITKQIIKQNKETKDFIERIIKD